MCHYLEDTFYWTSFMYISLRFCIIHIVNGKDMYFFQKKNFRMYKDILV